MVSEIRIYVEGGGDSAEQKAKLRIGFTRFLGRIKEKARASRVGFKVVPAGSRQKAYDAYVDAATRSHPNAFNILLVDSEEEIIQSTWCHLMSRDGWSSVGSDDHCQIMAQTMETWLITDRQALRDFYGQHFAENVLPNHTDLEKVAKVDIYRSLSNATRRTQKGEYQKIEHGSKLLELIDPDLAKSLTHCKRLFDQLDQLL